MEKSKSRSIKDALIVLVEGMTLNGEPTFMSVKGHPRGEFDGYPAARVLPADQLSEKGAYGQNERTVTLTIRVHLPYKDDGSEFDYMYDITDTVLDALDIADYEGDFNQENGTYILNATRGDWFDTDSQAGPLLACDIGVEVSYSKDL